MTESGHELVAVDVLDDVLLLRAALTRSMHEVADAEREIERLHARIEKLERQLERRRSEEVEELQRERLVAAAEARRIERSARPLFSQRTMLMFLYAGLLGLVAVLVAIGLLYS